MDGTGGGGLKDAVFLAGGGGVFVTDLIGMVEPSINS
jgi:hypothetical protein